MDLFYKRKKYSAKSRKPKKSPRKPCGEKLICDYGTFPIKQPMLIDDFEFKFKGDFIKNLEGLFYNVNLKNPSNEILSAQDKNPKNFIRDIMTGYMVSNIFKTRNQNKLIHIINTIMKILYDEYYKKTGIRLFFIYRGGNILKIYKTNFEKVLPGRAKKFFQQEFDEYFKNSDIDFYTVIENANKLSVSEINTINQYVEMMCFYGLWISRIFIMNNNNLFEFCKLNQVAFKEDMKDLVEIINNDKNSSDVEEIREANVIGLGFNRFVYLDEKYNLGQLLRLSDKQIIDSYVPGQSDKSVFENLKKYKKAGRFDSNIHTFVSDQDEEGEDELDELEDEGDEGDQSDEGDEEKLTSTNKIDYNQPDLFKVNFEKYMKDLVNKNQILDFYITHNNLIQDKKENVEFSLVRIMINFLVIYERDGKVGFTNSSSELFDLSIGHSADKMYYVYSSKNITEYPFKYDDENTDKIYIPKIRTTLTDLIKILFDIEYPWMDVKYEKRLYRLLLLTFVEELSKSDIYRIESLLQSKKKRKPTAEDDITFETLNYRNELLKNKVSTVKDKNKLKEYNKKYNDIIKRILKVIAKIKDFIESKRQFNPKDIYEFTFDPIVQE